MKNYPIRIRIGSASAGDYETKTYTNSTFAEAVTALQGNHDGDGDHHRDVNIYVVGTYAEDHTEDHGPKRQIKRKAGEPVFGLEVTVYGRRLGFGSAQDAEVSRGSMGSMDTKVTQLMINLETLALQLAIAANAEPFCPACQPELDRYAERQARLDAS